MCNDDTERGAKAYIRGHLVDEQVVRKIEQRLKALEEIWPPYLMLNSMDGTLALAWVEEDSPPQQESIIAEFPQIPSDGGGW